MLELLGVLVSFLSVCRYRLPISQSLCGGHVPTRPDRVREDGERDHYPQGRQCGINCY